MSLLAIQCVILLMLCMRVFTYVYVYSEFSAKCILVYYSVHEHDVKYQCTGYTPVYMYIYISLYHV